MKRVVLLIALLLLVIPGVAALDTEINVKAPSESKVSIVVLGAGDQYELLGSKHLDMGFADKVTYTYSGSQDQIKVNVKVKDENGKQLLLEKFGEFDAGEPLYLQAIPGDIKNDYMAEIREAEEAAAAEEAAKKAEEEAEAKRIADEEAAAEAERLAAEEAEAAKFSNKFKSITGNVIGDIGDVSKKTYYIIGGVLLVLVLGFMMMKHGMPSMPSFGGGGVEGLQKNLAREEEKAKAIRAKIKEIKGSKEAKIQAMEDRLRADEDELKKLIGKKKEAVKKAKDDIKEEEKKDDDKEEAEEEKKDD